MSTYVGIDIGKLRHCVAAIDGQGQVVLKPFVVTQAHAELEALDQRLRTLGDPSQTKIAIEATGYYWKLLWQFLLERGWQVEVLNPAPSASTARRHLRGRKTDADDALFIAKTLRDGGYHPLVVGSHQLEQIKTLCCQRRWSVGVMSNAKRRLASLLDQTFPEFATQFADPCGRAAFAVLKEAPNARGIAQLHLTRLTHLLCHGSNNQMGFSRAVKLRTAARQSVAVTHDDEALNCSVLLIVAQIEFLQEQIAQLGRQIGRAFDALDHPIKTIPGIGRATAPVILAELGCIGRFAGPRGAHRMLAFAGLDPCVMGERDVEGQDQDEQTRKPSVAHRALPSGQHGTAAPSLLRSHLRPAAPSEAETPPHRHQPCGAQTCRDHLRRLQIQPAFLSRQIMSLPLLKLNCLSKKKQHCPNGSTTARHRTRAEA